MFGESPIIDIKQIPLTDEEIKAIKDFYFDFTHKKEKVAILKSALLNSNLKLDVSKKAFGYPSQSSIRM